MKIDIVAYCCGGSRANLARKYRAVIYGKRAASTTADLYPYAVSSSQ